MKRTSLQLAPDMPETQEPAPVPPLPRARQAPRYSLFPATSATAQRPTAKKVAPALRRPQPQAHVVPMVAARFAALREAEPEWLSETAEQDSRARAKARAAEVHQPVAAIAAIEETHETISSATLTVTLEEAEVHEERFSDNAMAFVTPLTRWMGCAPAAKDYRRVTAILDKYIDMLVDYEYASVELRAELFTRAMHLADRAVVAAQLEGSVQSADLPCHLYVATSLQCKLMVDHPIQHVLLQGCPILPEVERQERVSLLALEFRLHTTQAELSTWCLANVNQ